jgi:hypothetical protein
MNIFYLDPNPERCAQQHLDKHVVKMILEYAQLLSTAHRMVDGEQYTALTNGGRKIQRWRLNDPDQEKLLFKASHVNHPSAIWARSGVKQYTWLYSLLAELCKEYTHRYGKHHKVEREGLLLQLAMPPKKIYHDVFWSDPTPAMPDECKIVGDALKSYHTYYIEKKRSFAKWTNRPMPDWFLDGINTFNETCYISYDNKRNRLVSMSTLLLGN